MANDDETLCELWSTEREKVLTINPGINPGILMLLGSNKRKITLAFQEEYNMVNTKIFPKLWGMIDCLIPVIFFVNKIENQPIFLIKKNILRHP